MFLGERPSPNLQAGWVRGEVFTDHFHTLSPVPDGPRTNSFDTVFFPCFPLGTHVVTHLSVALSVS